MKKILNTQIYLFFITVFLCTGCFKERIELDLNNGDNVKLAVEAWLTNLDEQQSILLSQTSPYLEAGEPQYVNDASVSIQYDSELIILKPEGQGKYVMPDNWRAETGKTYILEILHDDNEYTSSAFMKEMPTLEDFYFDLYETRDSIDYYDLFFGFQETPGEGDGYYAIDYKKGSAQGDTLLIGGFTNDDLGDGLYFSDVTVTNDGHEIGDTVILEAYSVGNEAADFMQDVLTEVFREGLFDPPPVNPRSNISNGAVGYFIVSGAERHELVVE